LKGIILAGGLGTRLKPLTLVVSKQLLPIYNKPLVYYPISTLMLAGLREILVIVMPTQKNRFVELLGNGNQFGISFEYLIQESPGGIAESIILAENFLKGDRACLILGDNIFNGPGLGRALSLHSKVNGAHIFGYSVRDPHAFGIATLSDDDQEVLSLEEKPVNSKSNIAVPGLYFFDETAPSLAKTLEPSKRGELEIIDLLEKYREKGLLTLEMLPRSTAWFDTGTFEDMHDASTYVRILEERTGNKVSDPLDIARIQGWVK
jgi:glucose-1-phosphate thymidylyltransferase